MLLLYVEARLNFSQDGFFSGFLSLQLSLCYTHSLIQGHRLLGYECLLPCYLFTQLIEDILWVLWFAIQHSIKEILYFLFFDLHTNFIWSTYGLSECFLLFYWCRWSQQLHSLRDIIIILKIFHKFLETFSYSRCLFLGLLILVLFVDTVHKLHHKIFKSNRHPLSFLVFFELSTCWRTLWSLFSEWWWNWLAIKGILKNIA